MKISIPKPCHENWKEMLPEEKGRFCLSCQKCVLDFTELSDDEILHFSDKDNICVKIQKSQIENINSSIFSFIPKWFKYSSLVLLFGFGKQTFAQNQKELKFTTSQIEELVKKDTVITIKLQLVDGFEETPISNAKVYLSKRKKKYSTKTDENGFFQLKIPTKFLYDYLIIENGYEDKHYPIRYLINEEKIGIIPEIIIGKIDFKKSNSLKFLAEKITKVVSY